MCDKGGPKMEKKEFFNFSLKITQFHFFGAPYMLEYTKQPLPVAWTSRIRPPVPVAAPGNGLTPKREKFTLC
jgi:hypothetical protein